MALPQNAGKPQSVGARIAPNTVRDLCTAILKEVAKQPKDVSIEDTEAAVVYALSQASPEREIVHQVLECAAGGATSANMRQAIENVRRSYAGTSGTGAIIRSGGAGIAGTSLFSPPVVGVGGGGGSNYTQR
jgi:hypothetical protein